MTARELSWRVAARLGLEVHRGPAGWPAQIRRPDGRAAYFLGTRCDLNPDRAVAVARNKPLLAYHLLRMGYPVPDGRAFRADELVAAVSYARELGLPVVVKPGTGTNGRGVAVVYDEVELAGAFRFVTDDRRYPEALVQRRVEGLDQRLVVLDGEIVAAYVRRPLSVTGEGRATIGGLLDAQLRAMRARGRPVEIEAADWRIDARLRRLGLARERVLAAGETVQLLESANMSTGGDAEDVSDRVHPDVARLARRLARDSGLRFFGLDLITVAPVTEELGGHWILELNPSPSLDHFCTMGEAQERRVGAILERVLRAMTS